MNGIRLIALLLLVGMHVFQVSVVTAAERVALVIGNGKYEHAVELPNPRNDAEDISATLTGLGFEVIKGIDLDHDGMESKIREFSRAVGQAKLALFFYAGHGMQVNGRNFLIPIDAELADSDALDWEAIDADTVFRHMGSADRVALAFLDACRNNPLARRFARALGPSRSASIGQGLAAPSTTGTGLFIGFATAPNDVALDGDDRNSPFTQALLKHLPRPGLEIQQLMTRVKADVWEATSGDQQPWHSSDLRSEVYLLPVQTGDAEQDDQLTADFEIARTINTKDAWEVFLSRYGSQKDSFLVQLAEAALQKLAVGIFPPMEESKKEKKTYDPGDVFRDCPDCPEMVVVPAGKFTMGSPESEKMRWHREGPQHEVTIRQPFAVGRFEVTRGEFAALVDASGHETGSTCRTQNDPWEAPSEGSWKKTAFEQTDDHPAVCLNWHDAKAYVQWLSKTTGEAYRLLSEAEWEYSARAGTTTRFSTGDTITTDDANIDGRQTTPVGTFKANAFGLSDLHGNVFEMVEDCWNDTYQKAPVDGSARTSGVCKQRPLRGGSWASNRLHLSSYSRGQIGTSDRLSSVGFRVARTLVPLN